MHEGMSEQFAAACADGGRRGGTVDAGPDTAYWVLRAELRALFGGLSDGGDLEADAAGKRLGSRRGPGRCEVGAAGHGVLRSRPMSSVGHGDGLHRVRRMVPCVTKGHLSAGSRDCGCGWE